MTVQDGVVLNKAESVMRKSTSRLRSSDFRAQHRGGGMWTEAVNQRIASGIAALAHGYNVHPSILTLANLLIGLATSGLVLAFAAAERFWAVGAVALVGWQLAYCLDCADGQLARGSGRASLSGARLDVFCDFAVQVGLVVALVAVASVRSSIAPGWLAAFAALWGISLFTSVMATDDVDKKHSLIRSSSPAVRFLKLSRDYGFQITVIGLWLMLVPDRISILLVAVTAANGLFLAAAITRELRLSMRGEK